MTRQEIREKFKFVKIETPTSPTEGYCYTGNLISIDSQIRNLKEGKNKIFYFKISPIDNDNISDGCINLALVSECVYLSPTKYV